MIKQELFEIWDQDFSAGDAKNGWIFKIYFKNFPESCYIGITPHQYYSSIKMTLRSLKGHLFKAFSGICPFQLLSEEYLLNEKEYQDLTHEQRESYNRKIAQKRQAKILEFEQDKLLDNEWKYWKMMMFMDIHHLGLQDLRFELLESGANSENREQFEAKRIELIHKHNAYISGFNSLPMIEEIEDEKLEVKSSEHLKLLKKLLKNSQDQYLKWNCWWNLYQIFKFSFSEKTLIWMDSWNEITVPQVAENFVNLSHYLFENKPGVKLPNLNYFDQETIEMLKDCSHENAKFFLNNQRTGLLKNRVNLEEWIKNDTQFFLLTCQIDLIEERDFLEFYGSWAEVKNLFQTTSLNHVSGFETKILPIFAKFLDQAKELSNFELSLWKYDWFSKLIDSPSSHLSEFVKQDLLFDYYFNRNFLNSLFLQNR